MTVLRVGDKVRWRGSWGQDPVALVTVTGIEDTGAKSAPRAKYGMPVEQIDTAARNFTVDLDNEHWAYGDQIEPIR